MPFTSTKQKGWMWANKPGLAQEWTTKYGPKIKPAVRKLTETDKRMKEKQPR